MSYFKFFRAYIRSGGFQAPSQILLANKYYNWTKSRRLVNGYVHIYEFDDLPAFEFILSFEQMKRLRILGDKYEKRIGKKHPIYFYNIEDRLNAFIKIKEEK